MFMKLNRKVLVETRCMQYFYLIRSTEFFNILLYQQALHEPDNSIGANLIGFDAMKIKQRLRITRLQFKKKNASLFVNT
jgi:hypothetical protein